MIALIIVLVLEAAACVAMLVSNARRLRTMEAQEEAHWQEMLVRLQGHAK